MTARDVIEGRATFSAEQADALAWLASLPDDSVSLCMFSPPYSSARLYLESGEDLGIARDTETWVAWMVQVVRECVRVCTGLVAIVCDDQTLSYRYGCAPYLLMADLHRAGYNLRRPCVYRRVGIPGSGGPDWFRCDHEPILCVTRPGRLPWSDNTACGHPPRWAPGGEMSHRLNNGARVNQWGNKLNKDGTLGMTARRSKNSNDETVRYEQLPSHNFTTMAAPHPPSPPTPTCSASPCRRRRQSCEGRMGSAPGHPARFAAARTAGVTMTRTLPGKEDATYSPPVLANPGTVVQRLYTAQEVADLLGVPGDLDLFGQPLPEEEDDEYKERDGRGKRAMSSRRQGRHDQRNDETYTPPVLANPGTVIDPPRYTAREVADLLGVPGDLVDVAVGGGQMGDRICHENEAPYPEELCERFVRSFAPVGSVVADPFCGSGTTLKIAVEWNRRAIGCDLRESQIALTKRRLAAVTPLSLLEG